MLPILFCMLMQFEPSDKKPPTLAEVQAAGLVKLKAECERQKAAAVAKLPTKKQLATLPRSKTHAITKRVKEEVARINARMNDKSQMIIPTFVLNRASPGQIGRPKELRGIADRRTGVITGTFEVESPEITVQQYIDEATLLCMCGAKAVVLRNYKGPRITTGSKINAADIYVTTGTYRVGDTVAIAFEKWEYSDRYFAERSAAKAKLLPTNPDNK